MTELKLNWYIDPDIPENTVYVFDISKFFWDNGELCMATEVINLGQNRRMRSLKWMKRDYEDKDRNKHHAYYKLCIDRNDVICYKCGNPVKEQCVTVRSTSRTTGYRRYYDKDCYDSLFQ